MTKTKNIPHLRFSEFKEEWFNESIGNLTEVYAGGTPRTTIKEFWKGHIRWMNSGELNLKRVYEVSKRITELGLKKSSTRLIPINSILIGLAGQGKTRGTAAINYVELCTNQSIASIFPKLNKFSPEFLYQNIDSRYDEIRRMSTGDGGRGGLNLKIIKSIKVNLPTLPEQEKIANFLTSIDKKIANLEQKKSLLESYKKGIMQKFFSQELRFKDQNGNDFPDWEEKKLGEMLSLVIDNRGKTPPVLKMGIPLLEVNSIGRKKIKYSKVSKFVDEETYNNWFRKYLIKGDILFSTVGNTALCSLYEEEHKSAIAQNIVGLRFIKENSTFMFYCLTNIKNNQKFKRIEMGAVQPSVKVTQMTKLSFSIASLEEQEKIANFLSGIDNKIAQVGFQLEKAQSFKKGLLQQMFV